jgi:uncharacterized protein YjbJ (UPF0337 family)
MSARPDVSVALVLPGINLHVNETEGSHMGDRKQRAKGKAEELKGRAKQSAGRATGRQGTEARGAAEATKGKTKNALGRAQSAVKKATR